MSKSDSKQQDTQREAESRVNKTHGGTLVESIATEDLVSFHDTDCKHDKLIRDNSETQFNAFVCANENCAEVVIFDKD